MDEKNSLDNATRRDLAMAVLDVVSSGASDPVKASALLALARLCGSAPERPVHCYMSGTGSHTFTVRKD